MLDRALAIVVGLSMALGSAGAALAGSEEAPEISDAAGDASHALAGQYADIVAAWIEAETLTDFTVVLKLATLDAALQRLTGYGVAFDHLGLTYFVFAFVDENARPEFEAGHLDREGLSQLSETDTTGEIRTGAPGYVRVLFPKSILDAPPPEGVTPAAGGTPGMLTNLIAGTFDFKPYAAHVGAPQPEPPEQFTRIDWAEGTLGYALNVTARRSDETPLDAAGSDAPDMAAESVDGSLARPGGAPAQTPAHVWLAFAAAALASLAARARRRT